MSAITSSPSIERDGTSAVPRGSVLDASEAQPEPRAAIAGPFERDAATVRLRDVLHDRQAEAGSRRVTNVIGSPETVEDARRVLRGDPGAVIAHGHLAVRDRDLHERAGRTVLRGVVEEVGDGTPDANLHAADRRWCGRHGEVHLGVTEAHVVDDLVDDLVQP